MDWPLRPRDWSLHSLAGWSLPAWNTCISMSRAANHISHTYSSIQEKGDGDAIMLFIVTGMSI
jgi:hypothetical protein